MIYHLCLGSNLGDREKNILSALEKIEKSRMEIRKISSFYETEPVDYQKQPDFYNLAVEIESSLIPHELLYALKKIEDEMGRVKAVSKGPRIIDIDILLAGDSALVSQDLIIPHPGLEKRNFMLEPLKEIAPNEIHPVQRESINMLSEE